MPLDYSVHPMGTPVYGNHPPAPVLPHYAGQASLAENTDSDDIAVTVPSVLCAVATVKLRLDVLPTVEAANLDPASSPIVLAADAVRFFYLEPGNYTLKTLAYA